MTYKKSNKTKQKILETTESLVLKKGFIDLNMKDISMELDIPRSLIYYYFKNKTDIMREIYLARFEEISLLSNHLVIKKDNPLLYIIIKYVLFFKFVVTDDLLREFFFNQGLYVSKGKFTVISAKELCYSDIIEIFNFYNYDISEKELHAYIITSDALIHALFKGLTNGSLDFTLKETILYFMERTIMISLNIEKQELINIIDKAIRITDKVNSI